MLKWRRESVLDIYNLHRQPAPRDDEVVASIRASAADLSRAAGDKMGPGAGAARNVSALLERLAGSDAATRASAEAAFIPPLVHDLDLLRKSLDPQRVTIKTLPAILSGTGCFPTVAPALRHSQKAIPTPQQRCVSSQPPF